MRIADIAPRIIAVTTAVAAVLFVGARHDAHAANGAPPRPPRAIAYAMYNEDLLFLAAKVEDASLTGSSATVMSEAWRDDSVDFYLDLSGGSGGAPHPQCVRIVASVVGGFAVLAGTPAGTWRPQPDLLAGLKLDVEREGTLNRPEDVDVGYTVEIGIPWRFFGGAPKAGQRVGFNFVVHEADENAAFVSWSSRVQSAADLDRPNLWGSMVFSGATRAAVAQNDLFAVPLTYSPPLVDGRLNAGEWLNASVIQLELPATEPARRPAAAGKPGARLLATYRYDYQVPPAAADARAFAASLAHQPPEGVGPWFSADSVAWHAAMLRQAREAAIDTILPVYRGDPDARHRWSRQGLLRLVQALKETKEGRLSYPLVGMYLDASCLPAAGVADLTSAAGKQALWGMVREFFSIVPDEFRAQFDIGSPQPANLLVLAPPQGVDNWDDACLDFCREMYLRTFGERLIILADDAWRAKAANLDGSCSLQPAVGMSYGTDGPRTVARLTPGYLGPAGMLSRRGGQTYEQNWMNTLASMPDFVIVDSLNDFTTGTEIAASRQYGVRFLDVTRLSAQTLAGRRQYQIAVLRETLPRILNQGTATQVELLVENQGFSDLSAAERAELSYTLQNKQRPDRRAAGVASPALLLRSGQRAPALVDVSARTIDGALPAGDYSLTFEITRSALPVLRTRWLSKRLFETTLPVRVDRAPAYQARVLSSTLPTALGAGARKRVRIRLRNDGTQTWKPGNCAVSYHWVRAPGPGAAADAQPEVVETEGIRTPLTGEVPPGKMISMYAWVEARKADGSSLPAWTPDAEWVYQVQWDLVEGKTRWFSRLGSDTYSETVAVLAADVGGTVVNADVPARMDASATYEVKVLLRNDGAATWDPARCRLTHRWRYWDGEEASAATEPAPVPPVAAGDATMVTVQVRAPAAAGSYRLAWDFLCDGQPISDTLDASARGPLVQPVAVAGGVYAPLDISQEAKVAASTLGGFGSRGAFDAAGSSFPAEFIPPDAGGPKIEDYPGIYYSGDSGSSRLARIPLRYPPKDQRGSTAVACRGQRIPLPGQPLRAIYIAASASEAAAADFAVAFADGTTQSAVLHVPAWTDQSAVAPVALRTPFRRTTQEDLPGPACVYLLRVGEITRRDAPTALVLPDAPQIKVFAITVERQPAETTGGS